MAWYRRHFLLPSSDRGRHLELQFDGVGAHCSVWVNGVLAHRNFCGYASFAIDNYPLAKYGDELNTIAVYADATVMEGWWYEGALSIVGGLMTLAIRKRTPAAVTRLSARGSRSRGPAWR